MTVERWSMIQSLIERADVPGWASSDGAVHVDPGVALSAYQQVVLRAAQGLCEGRLEFAHLRCLGFVK